MSDDIKITLTFRTIKDNCISWDDFCDDVGLNPWIFAEGLAEDEDKITIPLSGAIKHLPKLFRRDQ